MHQAKLNTTAHLRTDSLNVQETCQLLVRTNPLRMCPPIRNRFDDGLQPARSCCLPFVAFAAAAAAAAVDLLHGGRGRKERASERAWKPKAVCHAMALAFGRASSALYAHGDCKHVENMYSYRIRYINLSTKRPICRHTRTPTTVHKCTHIAFTRLNCV